VILADVYEGIRADPAFDHLRTTGIVLVPGEGSSRPKLFIVGEAPGATENTLKRPFVGASGRVLRSLIKDSAELEPQDYFITNAVKYRPPGNRNPEMEEIQASKPYLRQEYSALGSPPILVAVGGIALQALKPPHMKVGTLSHAGKPQELPGGRTLWPMIHPAYGLRNASARPLMEQHWIDFGIWFREEK
jgi:uracil-DNA glycosylase family 4